MAIRMAENQSRSRFLQQTMQPDEFIIRRGEFPWMYTFQACLKAGVWVALGFGTVLLYNKYGAGNEAAVEKNKLALFLPLLGMLIGGCVFIANMARKWTTEIVVTNLRFLYKSGVFSITVYKLNLPEINYCTVTQSLVGNMLNYGRILMYTRTLDDKNIYLPEISEPHKFTTEIENLKNMSY